MELTDDACYAALRARDRRFDGLFFVGVTTTGVYCRPICPARLPQPQRCEYFDSAARAESAGYRACLRCRPELAPGHASVDANGVLARRAASRIESGALNTGSVETLADGLGVTSRHLRRTMQSVLGVGPRQLAATRRAATAKRLLQDTDLPITTVALAAGYGGVRAFNRAFRQQFGRAPSEIRRRKSSGGEFCLRVDFRPPHAWGSMLAFLSARATPGVARAIDGRYEHNLRIGADAGVVSVRRRSETSFEASVPLALAAHVTTLVSRLRGMLDLDMAPTVVEAQLGSHPALADAVLAAPGLRVPGSLDPFELAVRTVLGQQVSVAAATATIGKFAALFGDEIDGKLYFPQQVAIAALDVETVRGAGIPRRRAQTLIDLAAAEIDLSPHADHAKTVEALRSIRGIGPWTSNYIAMRALRDPDAYPQKDLVLDRRGGTIEAAEAWRPWRAYAAMHLWNSETT